MDTICSITVSSSLLKILLLQDGVNKRAAALSSSLPELFFSLLLLYNYNIL
jgi:hypothetical protein